VQLDQIKTCHYKEIRKSTGFPSDFRRLDHIFGQSTSNLSGKWAILLRQSTVPWVRWIQGLFQRIPNGYLIDIGGWDSTDDFVSVKFVVL